MKKSIYIKALSGEDGPASHKKKTIDLVIIKIK